MITRSLFAADEVSLGEKSIEMRATTMEASQAQTASMKVKLQFMFLSYDLLYGIIMNYMDLRLFHLKSDFFIFR